MAKRSKWRTRARAVMDRVVFAAGIDAPIDHIIDLIDEAYPFGERAHYPYKMWLIERRITISQLTARNAPTPILTIRPPLDDGPLFDGVQGEEPDHDA